MARRQRWWVLEALLLALTTGPVVVRAIGVFKSQVPLGNKDPNLISGARLLDDRRVNVTDLTMCVRFNIRVLEAFEGRSRIVTIGAFREDPQSTDSSMFRFGARYPKTFFAFGHPRAKGSYKSFFLQDAETLDWEVFATDRWTHICFAYRKTDGFMRVVKVAFPEDFLSQLYLGRCSFDFRFACSPPEGQITDFNMWDHFMSEDQLRAWTLCRDLSKGSLVNWESAQFELKNIDVVEESMDSVCVPKRPGHVVFPHARTFASLLELCHRFHGKISVVTDRNIQQELADTIMNYTSCYPKNAFDVGFWAGWWDEPEEGNFTNVNTGEPLKTDAMWFYGEPNGRNAENCAVVWSQMAAWNDADCVMKRCGFCELERQPNTNIRGFCKETLFDTRYTWLNELGTDGSYYSFRGYQSTILQFDSKEGLWKLEIDGEPDTFATTNNTDYPFGTNTWIVYNDTCNAAGGDGIAKVDLNLNSCNRSEFNCGDGTCIDINLRCDGDINCPDRTDEISCALFELDSSYIKDSAPKIATASSRNNARADVTVDFKVLSILDVKDVDGLISLLVEIDFTWIDSRIRMLNLKEEEYLNSLDNRTRQEIWVPKVVFHNTKTKAESQNDDQAFAVVRRLGKFTDQDWSHIHIARVYAGADNPIILSRIYYQDFLCSFDMSVYPFDTQTCSAILTPKGNLGKFVSLATGKLEYRGPTDLTNYFVKNITYSETVLDPTLSSSIEAVELKIFFSRRILNTVLTNFLPTFVISLTSFATNYFRPAYFEAVVTANLTSLLVLTTLFISISDSLPQTAYVKMMDIWLIACLMIPFCEVILQTFIDYLREAEVACHQERWATSTKKNADAKESKTDFKKLKHMGRVRLYRTVLFLANRGLPAFYFAFCVAYFTTGALYYRNVLEKKSVV